MESNSIQSFRLYSTCLWYKLHWNLASPNPRKLQNSPNLLFRPSLLWRGTSTWIQIVFAYSKASLRPPDSSLYDKNLLKKFPLSSLFIYPPSLCDLLCRYRWLMVVDPGSHCLLWDSSRVIPAFYIYFMASELQEIGSEFEEDESLKLNVGFITSLHSFCIAIHWNVKTLVRSRRNQLFFFFRNCKVFNFQGIPSRKGSGISCRMSGTL